LKEVVHLEVELNVVMMDRFAFLVTSVVDMEYGQAQNVHVIKIIME
jgi:hypothetical protein